jgi:hypothetical protein
MGRRHLGRLGTLMDDGMSRGARNAIVFLFVFMLFLAAANLFWTSRQVRGLRLANAAACQFYADLSSAPVAVNPKTGKAALLGASIVADSRQAWRGRGCPGKLPPPDPSFVKWATYYHLPHN